MNGKGECYTLACLTTESFKKKYQKVRDNLFDFREILLDESLLGKNTVDRIKSAITDANDLKDGEVFEETDADTLKECWLMLITHV